jgi:hypothetical protein
MSGTALGRQSWGDAIENRSLDLSWREALRFDLMPLVLRYSNLRPH